MDVDEDGNIDVFDQIDAINADSTDTFDSELVEIAGTGSSRPSSRQSFDELNDVCILF